MSYRIGKSLGFPARARKAMAVTPPTKDQIVQGLRRAIKRAERWARSPKTFGSPPRHIAEKLQATKRLTVA